MTPKTPEYKVLGKLMEFSIWHHYLGSFILNFKNIISDLYWVTPTSVYRVSEKLMEFSLWSLLYWIRYFEPWQFYFRFPISTLVYKVSEKLKKISNRPPPYWIRNFEFSKSDFRFTISNPENLRIQCFKGIHGISDLITAIFRSVISDAKNRWVQNIGKIDGIFDMTSAVLVSPFLISKILFHIYNQRTRKPPCTTYQRNWNKFWSDVRHIGSAILNF